MELYSHQKIALDKLRSGSVLNGEVGTGKSMVSLAFYFTKVCNGAIEPEFKYPTNAVNLYIITTARKRDSGEWSSELSRYGLCVGNNDAINAKIIVDSWNNIGKYKNVKDSCFIFDEQKVSGYKKWSKTFIFIAKHNKWILLSATPGDTWMDYMPVFIANGYYVNKTDFVQQHVIYKSFMKYPVVDTYINTGKLLYLRDKILVPMSFIRKTTPHHVNVEVEYDKEEYFYILSSRWNPYTNLPIKNSSELCSALRRSINTDASRILALEGLIEKHKKVIVFYNYDYELDIIRYSCKALGIELAEWNGHNHDTLPETDKWVYATQYYAGAEGWNCTETNIMIFYSNSYSYKSMTQAAGRIDRLTTEFKDLYYYHLRSKAPIDRAIERCLLRKKDFNDSSYFKK
jgi:hypothetical protein